MLKQEHDPPPPPPPPARQVSKADGRPAGSTNGQYIEGRVRTFLAVVGLVFELVR
jgi:hypothetical protein